MVLTNNINKINKHQWDNLHQKSSMASFFQSRQCYDFYCSLSFIESFVFAVLEDDLIKGLIVGYIPKDGGKIKQFLSRRAIITGGALLADDIDENSLSKLLVYCKNQLKHKVIYIELRNYNDYSKYKSVFKNSGFDYQPHLNFHIDTSSMEIVQKNLGKSRKRDIKTSLRDGATVITSPNKAQIAQFYDLLVMLYKTRVKTPLFPFSFFSSLEKCEFAHFLLIEYDRKIVGGTLCVGLENQPLYEWFACGEDGKYKNIYPSTLATYAGLQYAVDHNVPLFDMMGAGKPNEGYGVRDFKAKFGGELVEHGRFLYICNRLLFKIGYYTIKIIKGK